MNYSGMAYLPTGSRMLRRQPDTLLALAEHLPAEAAEALLELATGGKPRVPHPPLPSQRRSIILTHNGASV
jgi:hypothetical protein